MIPMTLFWVLAVIFFVILEGVSVQLTSIWFAVGAVVSLLLSFFIGSIWAQIWVFLIVSFLCLLAVRPLAKKYFAPQSHKPTNVDSLIGREAVVNEYELDESGLLLHRFCRDKAWFRYITPIPERILSSAMRATITSCSIPFTAAASDMRRT